MRIKSYQPLFVPLLVCRGEVDTVTDETETKFDLHELNTYYQMKSQEDWRTPKKRFEHPSSENLYDHFIPFCIWSDI